MQSSQPDLNFRDSTQGEAKPDFIARLHREAPVYRDPAGFWVVSRFDDVRDLLLDHAHYSSSIMGIEFPLLSDDPPRHSRLRALVSKAFTPARVEALRAPVMALSRQLVAALPEHADVEIVDALTSPVPVAVIGTMLGVPAADHRRFKLWSDAIVGLLDDPFGGERMRTLREVHGYFLGLAAERRARPGDDLISAIALASEGDLALDDDGVAGFIDLLLLAGNETTTNLLSNLLDRFSREPEDWAGLRGQPARIEAAIEEALRTESPAQYVVRVARSDTRIGDVAIAQGDRLIVYLAAANRDPAKWAEPALFDLQRARERHLAFGHGVHFCLGAPLARLEAQCVLEALSDRFGHIAPGERPSRRLPTGLLFGFRELFLRFGA